MKSNIIFIILVIFGINTVRAQNPNFSLSKISDHLEKETVKYPNGSIAYEYNILPNYGMFGEATYYFPNGKIWYKGQFYHNRADGNWKFYYPNGLIALEVFYERRDGQTEDDELLNTMQSENNTYSFSQVKNAKIFKEDGSIWWVYNDKNLRPAQYLQGCKSDIAEDGSYQNGNCIISFPNFEPLKEYGYVTYFPYLLPNLIQTSVSFSNDFKSTLKYLEELSKNGNKQAEKELQLIKSNPELSSSDPMTIISNSTQLDKIKKMYGTDKVLKYTYNCSTTSYAMASRRYSKNNILISEGHYELDNKNRPCGGWKFYYSDGSLKEESNYNNGKVDGESKYYFKGNNKLQRIDLFNNDIFIGPKKVYDANGNQILNDGNGIFQSHYENGQLEAEITYKDGCRDGIAIWYYPNGKLKQKAIYKYDEESKPMGLRWEIISIFDPNGNPLEKGTLKNGNGSWIQYNNDGKKTGVSYYENGKSK